MIKLKLAILNTTIATCDGVFEVKTITLEEAKRIVKNNVENLDSAVGHQSTSDIMTTLLENKIETNMQQGGLLKFFFIKEHRS